MTARGTPSRRQGTWVLGLVVVVAITAGASTIWSLHDSNEGKLGPDVSGRAMPAVDDGATPITSDELAAQERDDRLARAARTREKLQELSDRFTSERVDRAWSRDFAARVLASLNSRDVVLDDESALECRSTMCRLTIRRLGAPALAAASSLVAQLHTQHHVYVSADGVVDLFIARPSDER